MSNAIVTPRLILINGTLDSLRAELESPAALARVLDVDVAASWPPELYDEGAIRWTIDWLEKHAVESEWSFYYIAESPETREDGATRPLIVGAGGFKGAPDANGIVELGYAIVPERRRRGYAREAVLGMLAFAFSHERVTRVIAHTLRELQPSIGVLLTSGFDFVGEGNDPTEPDAIQFAITRAEWESRE